MAIEAACRICGDENVSAFFTAPDIPVNVGVMWTTRDEAQSCSKGPIQLAFCPKCGHVGNIAFEPDLIDYDASYDNSLFCSPSFLKYARSSAADLVERYHLRDKVVLEIGCGKGEFLAMLCELGHNAGIGFDPSYAEGRADVSAGRGISFTSEYYPNGYSGEGFDFLCCRQVLEHLPNPRDFVRTVRGTMPAESPAAAFFEVPNAEFTLCASGMWDVIYPHCSYFSSASLRWLLASSGFHATGVRAAFGGQYLCAEVLPARSERPPDGDGKGEVESLRLLVEEFERVRAARVEELRKLVCHLRRSGKRALVWGAGAKGVMFLNTCCYDRVEYVVDLNPHKQGKFVPGTAQEIIGPDFVKEYRPHVIFVVNGNYREEIGRSVAELGVEAELISL